ncbi:hypothetical protein GCK72_011307 [Caenorhabditis remanei]|uniref:RING-type domain-containing protein n=1 Tax=Caenorhabditis remanei TaxID=31234 RepID=A0A6A5H9G2_CAERE|nr:hypothetical protein GCK72_011307 [Caenorhabditis remanei]KAF1763042.1 hypothetical protein GCK72_011307 [Caenorhabditis remanei]
MLKPFCHSTIPVLLAAIATLYSIALLTVDNSDLPNLCWVTIGCAVFYKSLEILKNRMTCQNNMMLVGFSGILISTLIARIAVFWSVNYKLIAFYTSTASIISFYTIFIFQYHKTMQPLKLSNQKTFAKIVIGNILLFVISCLLTHNYAIIFNCGFGLIGAASMIDLVAVWVDGCALRARHAETAKKEFDLQKMDVHSWNDVTMYCFAVLLGFLSIFGLLGLVFSENFALSTAYHIAGSSAVVTVTLVAMKYTLDFFNRYFEVDQVKKWRNNMVVGLAGIVICGVAARIVVYSYGIGEKILPFLLSIPIYSSILFYYLFVYGYRQHCFINHQNQNFPKIWIPMVNLTFSVILARTGIQTDLESMIYIQVLFFVLSVFSGVDLVIILNGGLRSIHEEMEVKDSENEEKSTEELKPKKRIYPRIPCTSCDSEYSDSKPPRILPECGHSICGNCAKRKLSKKNKLTCPACQTVHFVKKGVKGLFKNFTLLDMIEEARKIMDKE